MISPKADKLEKKSKSSYKSISNNESSFEDLKETIGLTFDNLNDCVASLLKKSKGDGETREVKRRHRKENI